MSIYLRIVETFRIFRRRYHFNIAIFSLSLSSTHIAFSASSTQIHMNVTLTSLASLLHYLIPLFTSVSVRSAKLGFQLQLPN
ncbi:hypothetical protein VNO80_06161 [Phaseolus coccineus]|uniref:Uncharacterized protein n=1 Tax=Phaseolus coccineus TaxID=3886 RepID=A0AAN9NNB4_PHACN